MKFIILILMFFNAVLAQNNIPRDSTVLDTAQLDTNNQKFKIAIYEIKNSDKEFSSYFSNELYNRLNIVRASVLQNKYKDLDLISEKNWYNIAEKEEINYILFLDVKSGRVKCTQHCVLFFMKTLSKEVDINVKVFSVGEQREVYSGKINVSYISNPRFSLRSCENIIVNTDEIELFYTKAYDLSVKKLEDLVEQMGIYKENYYEQ